MNLLDKYVTEVGKHLPRKNRVDIEAEIRSTLEDMLEERSQGKAVDDEMMKNLLKEYGSPKKVAATYKPKQYLISPRMFPIFELVTRIVLTVLFAVSLFGLGVGLVKTGLSGAEVLSQVGGWAAGLFTSLTAALGNIVLVFAIIERTQAVNEFEKEFEDWDPAELEVEPDPAQLKRGELIVTIVFTVLGLVIFNLYPDLIAIHMNTNGEWTSTPIFTDAFFRFLPWINVMGLAQIGFSIFMLAQEAWKPFTRMLGLLVDVFGAVLTVAILTTPHVFSFTAETWGMLEDTEAANFLTKFFEFIPTIIMVIVVVATIVKVVQVSIDLVKGRSATPYPVIK
jgi:hypothetical protein